jgi:hypothetical protein
MKKEPIGILFDSLRFYSLEDLETFIKNMTSEQAIYCLIEATKYSYNQGIYTLEESEILSKIIRLLSKEDE